MQPRELNPHQPNYKENVPVGPTVLSAVARWVHQRVCVQMKQEPKGKHVELRAHMGKALERAGERSGYQADRDAGKDPFEELVGGRGEGSVEEGKERDPRGR